MCRIAVFLLLLTSCTTIPDLSVIDLYELKDGCVYKAHVSKGVAMAHHTFAKRLRPVQKDGQKSGSSSLRVEKSVQNKAHSASKVASQQNLTEKTHATKPEVKPAIKPETKADANPATNASTIAGKQQLQADKPVVTAVSGKTSSGNPSAVKPSAAKTSSSTASAGNSAGAAAASKPSAGLVKKLRHPLAGGRLISEFGASDGLNKNDGVNFKARLYDDVYAAADGVVLYSGELGGYGKIVVIRHADDVVTSYSHLHDQCVHKGDHVARGDVVGYVGATGDVFDPQLHFEVIIKKKNVDPMRYIQ